MPILYLGAPDDCHTQVYNAFVGSLASSVLSLSSLPGHKGGMRRAKPY